MYNLHPILWGAMCHSTSVVGGARSQSAAKKIHKLLYMCPLLLPSSPSRFALRSVKTTKRGVSPFDDAVRNLRNTPSSDLFFTMLKSVGPLRARRRAGRG